MGCKYCRCREEGALRLENAAEAAWREHEGRKMLQGQRGGRTKVGKCCRGSVEGARMVEMLQWQRGERGRTKVEKCCSGSEVGARKLEDPLRLTIVNSY